MAALLIALCAAPMRAAAAPAADRSARTPQKSSEKKDQPGPQDSGAFRSKTAVKGKTGPFEAPGWVMARSLVIPGWGQLHNGSWIKALGVAGAEVWMGTKLLNDRRTLNDIENQVTHLSSTDPLRNQLVEDYNNRLNGYTSRQWLMGGIVAYALLDAYVDAHFRGFKVEFDSDPALEGDQGDQGGKKDAKLRVFLRRTF